MRLINISGLLSWTAVFFSTGLVTGWWLHDNLNNLSSNSMTPPGSSNAVVQTNSSFTDSINDQTTATNKDKDTLEFSQSIIELRNDDALVIYQHHERQELETISLLRQTLLDQIDLWTKLESHEPAIKLLELFVQHYYQDTELLKPLASLYESSGLLEKAIDIYIDARSYAYRADQAGYFDQQVHDLAKTIFKQKQQKQTLGSLIPQFQKLASQEPDYNFYHHALAKSHLSVGDTDNAILELQILQLDSEYGEEASRLLAKLFPAPVVEEPQTPAGVIPLTGSGGHFIVAATLGGASNTKLMIDTGATLTALSGPILQDLRNKKQAIRIGHVELKTANGVRLSPMYRVKKFQIGSYFLDDLDIVEIDQVGLGADGLLGMNVLGRFHFFINQNQKTLSLSPL